MNRSEQAVAVFDKCATKYQERFMDTAMYQDTFDVFCDSLNTQNATVIDVACGPGNITMYLLHKRPDLIITGIDLSANMLALAKINNPGAVFELMDCREIAATGKRYDGMVCGFCLPYLTKTESQQLIADAATVLSDHGVLYLSTMEGDNERSGLQTASSGDKVFVNYHESGYLTNSLIENGFSIIKLSRKEYTTGDVITTDLVIIAAKKPAV